MRQKQPVLVVPVLIILREAAIHVLENIKKGKRKMKQKKRLIIAGIALVLACVLGIILYQQFAPKGVKGGKAITVTVVHGDKSEKDFKYQTDEEYLGAVLKKEELVEGEVGEFGLFITSADGEKADDSKQQWWCLTKGGEQLNTSADQTPIKDGEAFEITLTEGY